MPDNAMNSSTRLWTLTRMSGAVLFFTFLILFGTRPIAAATNQQDPSSQIAIAATLSGAYTTLHLTLPQAADLSTVRVVLNGKEITTRVGQIACPQGLCMAGTISEVDGLRSGKNVVYATAKYNSSNGMMSGRTRFSSLEGTAQPSAASHALLRGAAQPMAAATTSGSTGFLPPTVTFQTNYGGGWDPGQAASWLQVGSAAYPDAGVNCSGSRYMLLVFNRQTLQPNANAPAPCVASGSSLKSTLSALGSSNPGALVVVGTISQQTADNTLDTSLIGGNDHTKDSPAVGMYVAIGIVGAAPGTAYELQSSGG